jgi:hypothetical protein
MKRLLAVVIAVAACCLPVDAGPSPESVVARYLDARTREDALAVLAPGYRLWFGKREGEGLDKAAVAEMLEWDFALRPRHRVDRLEVSGAQVVAVLHEENDFSLLIGFPGWDATSTFTVEDGLIASQVYVPRDGQSEWKPFLERALPWLREHRAEALARVYPKGRLDQSARSAREWVAILRDWRKATGQGDPTQ